MLPENPNEEEIDETKALLRASLERAHELVCEAREAMRAREEIESVPPNHPTRPASW
jgi:hypothetical protein